jgi:DNA invertase Pin-like site-specific DNA recombinase
MIIGYCRVSTDGQSLEGQQSALLSAGANKVFAEKQSGAKTDRKALAKAIAALSSGDVLLVTRLDRLARSTRDLLNVMATISEKGAGFRSLADPLIDTTSPHGKLILAVLGALAEFERSMILARTSEGRARAQARVPSKAQPRLSSPTAAPKDWATPIHRAIEDGVENGDGAEHERPWLQHRPSSDLLDS